MALTVVHAKVNAIPDDPAALAAGQVLPSDWNANHTVAGTASDSQLPDVVTAGGPTGSATAVPVITYDAKGRLTAVTTASITQPTGANPSASVGLTAVNGSAATFMRSDGAPAYDPNAAFAFAALGLTHVSDTTQSTTSTTGSLTTAGGIGVAKNVAWGGVSLAASGTSTAPGYSFSAQTNRGFYYNGGQVVATANAAIFAFDGNGIELSSGMKFGWTSAAADTQPLDAYWGRLAPASIVQGGAASATPVNQIYSAQSSRAGTDSNVGGANLTVAPGTGTGTGTLAALIANSPIAVASGSGAQTQTRSFAAISGSLVVGPGSALTTTATDGFLYLPSCAGSPTGVPTANTGALAHAYDSTNEELEIYSNGQWNGIPVSGGINTAPAGNVTLRASYSLIVIESYTIAAAKTLTLGADAKMRII